MALIAAISTPRGQGGIAVVRMSGPGALETLEKVFKPASSRSSGFRPWHMRHGSVLDKNGEPLDDVLAVFMPGPNTFTGEDIAEIHCHGSDLIAREVLESLFAAGARQAGRGEFTRRAFVNGRMDLSQAEAVAEMIAAPTREGLRYGYNRLEGLLGRKIGEIRAKLDELRALACIGLDFPDDEIEGLDGAAFAARVEQILEELESLRKSGARARAMEGRLVVLAGRVNAGKSSLLNALAGCERALVASIPGTTRDFLETSLDLDGVPVCLVDTAGLRENSQIDAVEAMGMARSRELAQKADAVVLVLDGETLGAEGCASPLPPEPESEILACGKPLLVVWNKCDIAKPEQFPPSWAPRAIMASAATGENLDSVAEALRCIALAEDASQPAEHGLAPNARQALAIGRASEELKNLLLDIKGHMAYDCWAARLDGASAALDDILGLAPHEELLNRIFSQFCIGK